MQDQKKTGKKPLTSVLKIFFWICLPGKDTNAINKQIGLHQTKKLLHSEGNQQNKSSNHQMKIFANNMFDKGLIPKIHKNSHN